MTALYGILGDPVAHSRSPDMHKAAFAALGIDATYVRFRVTKEHLRAAVRGLQALDIQGANVTVPHKEAVLAYLDEVSDEARAIGAVNTIVRQGERLLGHNTDADGLVRALEERGVNLANANVVIVGAGGAARASVVGLARRGAAKISVMARKPALGTALIHEVRSVCSAAVLEALPCEEPQLRTVMASATLLVQATSATLGSGADTHVFAQSLPLEALPKDAHVIDLVYNPLDTAVLARAAGLGLRTLDGLGMLLHQGALAFTLWTGRPAPLEAMRMVLRPT
jgi:shikimate dehydrogenase